MRLVPRNSQPIDAMLTVATARNNRQRITQLRWLVSDISERKQAEAQLRSLNAELARRVRFETSLNRITDKVRESLDEDQILQTAAQELTLTLDLLGCDVALYNPEQKTSTVSHLYSSVDNSRFSAFGKTVAMSMFPEGTTNC